MHRTVKFLVLVGVSALARAPFFFLRHPREAVDSFRTGLRLARIVILLDTYVLVGVPYAPGVYNLLLTMRPAG